MGMKEKCVCSTGRGFWDEQNCWLCKLCIWFLMNLSSCSLATELLLLAGDEQHKHTHTRAHTQKLHLQCKNFLHKKARTELYFVKKWGLSSNSRKKCFYSGWSLILIDSFLCSTRAIYIISESFMYHWAYTCDWGALHVGLLCSYFFQDFPRVNRERSEHSWRETTVCACADMCIRVWAQVWDASLQPDPTVSIFTQYSEIWRKATCFNIYGCGQTLNPPTLSKSRDSMRAHAPTDG